MSGIVCPDKKKNGILLLLFSMYESMSMFKCMYDIKKTLQIVVVFNISTLLQTARDKLAKLKIESRAHLECIRHMYIYT